MEHIDSARRQLELLRKQTGTTEKRQRLDQEEDEEEDKYIIVVNPKGTEGYLADDMTIDELKEYYLDCSPKERKSKIRELNEYLEENDGETLHLKNMATGKIVIYTSSGKEFVEELEKL